MTASLAACGKPDGEIVPYVRMPERLVGGEPVRYATALPLSGYGRGVLVTAVDGRPIKIEGNGRHPASLGATDVFLEADILSLYDPSRSRTVLHEGRLATRESFRAALGSLLGRLAESRGKGLRILTGRVASPTLARQLDILLRRFPAARWHAHEPAEDGRARDGARLAFGRPLDALPRLTEAGTIVALGADPLGPGPDALRLARDFAAARRPGPAMSRLYVAEPSPTLTGAKADIRLALPPDALGEVAVALANALGAGLRPPALPPDAVRFAERAVHDLGAAGRKGIVLAGPALPPAAQALAHWINAQLGAPVDLIEPVDRVGGRDPGTLAELARDLDGLGVDLLLVLGCNPAFDAPGDLLFADAMGKARTRVHLAPFADETAAGATWHLPAAHPLESWSDLLAPDGTATIAQPLIRPLYGTPTLHEWLAEFTGEGDLTDRNLVRATWGERGGADHEAWWREALHDGVVPDTRAAPVAAPAATLPTIPAAAKPTAPGEVGLFLSLRPDPCVWDGRYGNNAWLQELPKPLTKQVWGNALALGPDDARRLGIADGDRVYIKAGDRSVEVGALIEPGHAAGCGALTFGLGRRAAGPVGNGVGSDVFPLRRSDDPWMAAVTVTRAPSGEPVLRAATVVRDRRSAEENAPSLDLAGLLAGTARAPETGPLATLMPDKPRDVDGSAHAWGMVIDTAACIGCNACIVSCQSENNVPVVGPEEIARGRLMQWLRVDVYDRGTPAAPDPVFQPVPCMHCEHAPCEPVCPVAASVHDSEGLNVQVYNRCVGTRFCEANCPYKVRRFNFYGYADGQEYADLGFETYRAGRNPDVTVRARGVMEKCTYCVQRISRVRREAERDGRPMPTDAVTTACQNACPTRAITFGDLKDPAAAIQPLKADPRHYGLMAHLGTRPRTTYLAEVSNRSPDALAPSDRAQRPGERDALSPTSRGKVGEGGRAGAAPTAGGMPPTPDPSPQGGGERVGHVMREGGAP